MCVCVRVACFLCLMARASHRGVVVNVLYRDDVVTDFELSLWEGMNLLFPSAIGEMIPLLFFYKDKYGLVSRRNGVISLVTVFEESSHVTNSFWLRDKVNQKIRLFHEHALIRVDVVICTARQAPILYIPDLRRVSDFHMLLYGLFCLFLEYL